MRFRCNACLGEFGDVLADGMRYFHACAPAIFVTVTRGAATIEVPIEAVQPGDVVISHRYVERPNRRDENVRGGAGDDRSEPLRPGGGRVPI